MMITRTKNRVAVFFNGYSDYYSALVSGAPTGAVSFPAGGFKDIKDDELTNIALLALQDPIFRRSIRGHVIRKLDRVF